MSSDPLAGSLDGGLLVEHDGRDGRLDDQWSAETLADDERIVGAYVDIGQPERREVGASAGGNSAIGRLGTACSSGVWRRLQRTWARQVTSSTGAALSRTANSSSCNWWKSSRRASSCSCVSRRPLAQRHLDLPDLVRVARLDREADIAVLQAGACAVEETLGRRRGAGRGLRRA